MLIMRDSMVKFTVTFLLLFLLFACRTAPEAVVTELPAETTAPSAVTEIVEFDIPESIMLCGEKIDLTNQKNYEMFDREFTISVWDRAQVFMWLKRSGKFFPYFERRLKEAGLPDDLKYLAVAESSLHTHIKSKAGALGIWQFMRDTAKRYGLRVERGVIDERLCYERSTDVALKYLEDLKEKFETWTLVMAAYNCGENKLNAAVKNQGEDYVNLYLPRETERYVFRIAAIKYLMEHPVKFGYIIQPERAYRAVASEKIDVSISDRLYISDLVKQVEITYKEFMKLNPQILSSLLPKGKYTLNVPTGSAERFALALKTLNDPSERKKAEGKEQLYVVQPGDALYNISWETGVPVRTIKRLNQLKNSRIYPGQKLVLRR